MPLILVSIPALLLSSSTSLESPKSATLALKSLSIRMFAGCSARIRDAQGTSRRPQNRPALLHSNPDLYEQLGAVIHAPNSDI